MVMAAELSDEELMGQIRNGDEEAFRMLIERHQDRVYGTVARMMGGAGPEAEEVAQDIFLRVWRAAPTYRPEAKFTTWLMTVVRNLVFTRSAQRARRRNIDGSDPMDEETGESIMTRVPDPTSQTAVEALSSRELERAVEEIGRAHV